MLAPESAPLFFRELEKIASLANAPREQVLALAGLMERLFFEATKQEQIAFSSLFARISYVGHLFHFQEDTLRTVHGFRLAAKRVRGGQLATEAVVQLGLTAVAAVVTVLTGTQTPLSSVSGENLGLYQGRIPNSPLPLVEEASGPGWLRMARVVALRDEPQDHCLMARDEENPIRVIRVRYALPTRNEHFMPTIQLLRKVFGFPVVLNLLDVDVDAAGDYCPRAFVVEPDYLMDVSAISECFKDTGPEPYAYLVKKFLPNETNAAMLLGNIANFFLDRLLNEPSVAWQPLFRETFQLYPFTYAPMSDAEVREISGKAQKHFLNLKSMASGGLAQQGIQPDDCVLEPTFFSAHYGIQGRLDLFYRTERASAIVELKSGKPYKPNSYGIQRSHFTQTLLYDLLVRSVFGHSTDPAKYILYSGVDVNHLRFAPTIAPEQWEALQLRNQLVALERLLTKIRPGDEVAPVLNRLKASNGQGFMERDFRQFEVAYAGLSRLEKKYFNAFTGFAAREHWLAKVGEENAEVANGHASLWRSDFERKQADFSILSHLEILENRADQPEPCIIFQKTSRTHPLANFRVGDIAVLYPALEDTDTVLRHQIIKCTITEIGSERVAVQPRYRQFNLKPFETEGTWRLEPDMMDTGFAAMYRGLLDWAGASAEKRALVLGERAPDKPTPGTSGAEAGVGLRDTLSRPLADTPQSVITGLTEDTPEGITSPLPSGEGLGVGLRDYHPPRKTGSFGNPEETTPLDRWQYLKNFARMHRKHPTDAEAALWDELRGNRFLGIKFRRQHAVDEYIVDFVSLEDRLVIEVDGEAHALQTDYDEQRTEYLGWFGFAVVRFTNDEVLRNMEDVKRRLAVYIKKRKEELASTPPPKGGETMGTTTNKIAISISEHSTPPLPSAPDNPTPDPSPEGRGGVEDTVEDTPEGITPPLPSGAGAGVGLRDTLSRPLADTPQSVITGATEDVSEGITPPPPSGAGFSRLIASRDYFLLWGPPGTGKTSVMLRDLADWVLRNTTDNLLLLAYTNRAVDEICEALDNIQDDIRSQYVRIGGKHATAERFRDQLLSTKIAGAKNRAELRAVLESHRIFVSTVASFGQNEGLLRLKKFHRLVVDEASQILEPQLIGLLTHFEHFTLIGDHRQLPAVTAQRTASTTVEDADLQSIGLTDLRDSYFERLYRHCQAKGWHWAYGQLERQGRMHADIMDFPKKHFYDGNLHTLASTPDEQHRQHQALWYDLPGFDAVLEKTIAENRVVFMPVAPEDVLPNQKTSRPEAEAAARIVLFFKKLYAMNGKAWRPTQTLGIITPWRAQIAQLRASLSEVGLDPDELTIDTVERYQGGARDIILISTCVHSEEQLASLVNLSSEGVDRKMNVALTRAREHVVMLGNEPVLRKDAHYDAFIEQYKIDDVLRG